MKKSLFLLLVLSVVLLTDSCSKEEIYPSKKEYPVINTEKPADLDATGVTFAGRVVTEGNRPIRSYGFVWFTTYRNYEVKWNGAPQDGVFTYRASSDLGSDISLVYRAFVETAGHQVFGPPQAFTSLGELPPEIVSFSPASGPPGTRVTMIAKNLSHGLDPASRVYLRQYQECQVLSVDVYSNTLVFEIPPVDYLGAFELTLDAKGFRVTAAQKFTIEGLQITGISQSEGFPGDEMTITGTWFTHFDPLAEVYFSTYPATVKNATNTELRVIIPVVDDALLKDVNVRIIVENGPVYTIHSSELSMPRSWEQKASPPFEGSRPYQAFSYQGKGFILEPATRKLYAYDPLTDQWTVASDYPGTDADNKLLIVFDQQLLVFEGGSAGSSLGQLWNYDLTTRQWQLEGALPFGFDLAVSFEYDDKWYLVTDQQAVWAYDPAGRTFSRKNDFPQAFNGFGFAYRQGADIKLITYGATWQYQPISDSWTSHSANPFIRIEPARDAIGFEHRDNLYVLANGEHLYKYLDAGKEWRLVSRFPECAPAYGYKTTFTIDDHTYFAGFTSTAYTFGCTSYMYEYLN